MSLVIYLLVFVFGLIIGSFLNVVILRYHSGQSLAGRSHCLSCGANLSWLELFPVVSFLIQGGRCRECHCKISWQYPLVELLTGFLFVLVFFSFGAGTNLIWVVYYLVVVSLLVAVTVYDLKHKIIPDLFVFLIGLLALLKPWLVFLEKKGLAFVISDYKTALLGGGIAGLVFFLLWFFSAGRWLGFGDVKLAFAVGLLLGPSKVWTAMVLAVWLGAIAGLALIVLSKTKLFGFNKYFTIKSELPFAPFIVLGVILNLIFQINVF